eukprot:UN29737
MDHFPRIDKNHWHEPEWYLSEEPFKAMGLVQDEVIKWLDDTYGLTPQGIEDKKKGLEKDLMKKGMLENSIIPHYADLGIYNFRFKAGTREDYLGWYHARSQLCRNAHHPGNVGHFLAGQQTAYFFLTKLKETIQLAMEAKSQGDIDDLYRKGMEKMDIPEPGTPTCQLPGAGEVPQCFMSIEPRQGTSLEDVCTDQGGWSMDDIFEPHLNERRAWGYTDIHKAYNARNVP